MFSILAPIDFSTCSTNALNYAVSFADVFGAKLTILHAFHNDNINSESFGTKEECLNELEQLKNNIQTNHQNIDCHIKYEEANVIDVIHQAANSGNYDLFIMGTHGRSRSISFEGTPLYYESIFGSVTATLVGYSNIPIIAVHEKDEFIPPKEFILLSDFHRMPSTDSYKYLSLIASKFDCSINILYVETKPAFVSDAFLEMNKIEDIFKGIDFTYTVIKANDIESVLLNMPLEKQQLLTVISKDKSGLKELFGVSLSQELLAYLNGTLLILPEYIAVYPSRT